MDSIDIMVSITEEAVVEVKKILEKEKKSDHGLRLFTVGSGHAGPQYGISLAEKPQKGDSVLKRRGLKIFVGKDAAKGLNGSTIDHKETPQGPSFVITSPSSSPCCGGSGTCH